MSAVYSFRLRPRAPFHLGVTGLLEETDDVPRSDTLFSALWAVAAQSGRAADFERLVFDDPAFRIASLFPCAAGIEYYPRPRGVRHESLTALDGKTLKRVRWVSRGALPALLRGGALRFGEAALARGILSLEAEPVPASDLLRKELRASSAIDRLTGAAEPFSREVVVFGTEESPVDLHGKLVASDEAVRLVTELLEQLGRHGLGGERSLGFGRFDVVDPPRPDPAPPFGPAEGDRLLTLSLFRPSAAEVGAGVLEQGAQDRVIRGGWIERAGSIGYRRVAVGMLVEGSTCRNLEPQPQGTVANVAPQGHGAVYRFGRPLAIPFRDQGRP